MKYHIKPSPVTLALAGLFSLPALAAQSSLIDADEVILVSANRVAQPMDQVLSAVRVIDRREIEQIQPQSISDLLEVVAGLDIARQGGAGQQSSLFSRGTDSGHVMVVVNGQRIGSATDGAPALSNIPTAQIERIEVIKGPRAALWGSDAIGGVIQIFTRELAAGEFVATLEAGTHHAMAASVATGFNHGEGATTLSLSHEQSRGFDALNDATAGSVDSQPDDDGRELLSLAVNGRQPVNPQLELGWLVKLDQGNSEFDSIFGGDETDFDHYQWQLSGHYRRGAWAHEFNLGQTDEASKTFGNGVVKSAAAPFETRRDQFNLISRVEYSDALALAFGVDRYQERVTTGTAYVKNSREVQAYFGQLMFERDGLMLQSALRYDDIQGIDAESTYNVSLGYRFLSGVVVSLNAGQGFKAPSFNDLYYPFGGNSELVSETSDSLELLLRARPWGIATELTLYHTDIDNLIEWSGLQSENIARADIQGAELSLSGQALGLMHRASLSYVDAKNGASGEPLIRRAKNNLAYQVSYHWQAMELALEYQYHGRRQDLEFLPDFTSHRVTLDDYQLFNLSVGYQLAPQWRLRLKANNITDEHYSSVRGYNAPGAEYFLSLSYQPH